MKTITLTIPSIGSMNVTATDAQLEKLLNEICDRVPGRTIHYRVI